MVRLALLEEYLMERMRHGLDAAHDLGAHPDELLAACAVVYLRSVHDYSVVGDVEVPVVIARQYHDAMYRGVEVA